MYKWCSGKQKCTMKFDELAELALGNFYYKNIELVEYKQNFFKITYIIKDEDNDRKIYNDIRKKALLNSTSVSKNFVTKKTGGFMDQRVIKMNKLQLKTLLKNIELALKSPLKKISHIFNF